MLTLVFLCLPVLGVSAAPQERTADYTVEYIGRGDGTEQTLGKKTFRALAGETVNVETEEFANYEREPGQDMTLLVTADGKAVKKIYYTRIFYDRIVFQTQGSYIPPVYGNRGDDIREEMSRIPEPERPGYIFLGWEPELPETMPEGELTVHALWEPGESQYTVLRWMEHAEDEEYSLLGEPEVRTARTGSTVTASQEDIDRAGEMADWFPDSDEYKDFYGFDYAGCSETVVTADGKAVLHLYYDREIWKINLHERAEHESGTSDALLPNEEIWYTAEGKYGAPLPEDFPTFDEMAEHYEQSGALQGMHFLGVRDEFEAVSRSLDTFYFQDLAKMNHTFDAYPWLDNSAYPIFVTYFVEKQDGTFRRVGGESLMVDKDPDIYGAEVTVFHPTGLTCEEGWYTTGGSPEICENAEKIPVRPEQIQGDERCVFRSVGSHLYVYMKKDTFTLSYMDIDEDGRDLVYRTEDVKYKQEVSMTYEPEGLGLHVKDRFTGWYLSPALAADSDPLSTIRMPAKDIRVYAGWDEAVWTVWFDGGEVQDPAPQKITNGDPANVPELPEREGCLFLGWFLEADGKDSRKAWDFQKPVEEDLILYAGWYDQENTSYTVRHVIRGEDDPFREEERTGKAGDTFFARGLCPGEEGCPAGYSLENGGTGQKVTLEKEAEENIVTLYYRKAEKIPETGDQEETAKIAVRTAAAGIAVLLLLAVRKKKRLALK